MSAFDIVSNHRKLTVEREYCGWPIGYGMHDEQPFDATVLEALYQMIATMTTGYEAVMWIRFDVYFPSDGAPSLMRGRIIDLAQRLNIQQPVLRPFDPHYFWVRSIDGGHYKFLTLFDVSRIGRGLGFFLREFERAWSRSLGRRDVLGLVEYQCDDCFSDGRNLAVVNRDHRNFEDAFGDCFNRMSHLAMAGCRPVEGVAETGVSPSSSFQPRSRCEWGRSLSLEWGRC